MGYVVHLLMQFSSSVKQTTNQKRELSHPDLWLAKSLNRVFVFFSTSFMFTFVGYRAPRSSQPRPRARHASNIKRKAARLVLLTDNKRIPHPSVNSHFVSFLKLFKADRAGEKSAFCCHRNNTSSVKLCGQFSLLDVCLILKAQINFFCFCFFTALGETLATYHWNLNLETFLLKNGLRMAPKREAL